MSRRLPHGSWDTHCHVFGPAHLYPWAAERSYTPDERPRESLFALHQAIGADHAVIVHPACHGYDMRVTLDTIKAGEGRYRGIALVPGDIAIDELQRLHDGGIRGIRFNYARSLGQVPDTDMVLRLADRIAPLGWHIVLHFDPDDIAAFAPIAAQISTPYVIDHLGRIRVEGGLDQEPFQALLGLAQDPRCWIKISGADRASAQPPHYQDTIPFAQALVAATPDHILWGTDWPHPNVKGPVPIETDLIDLLEAFVPETGLRHRILIDNPNRLYGEKGQ